MRLFKCKHRRLSVPINGHRCCTLCGAEFPYTALTLTEQDKQQAAEVNHPYDRSNLRNRKAAEVVRPMRRKGE